MLDLIVSVPDHCLSFYSVRTINNFHLFQSLSNACVSLYLRAKC